jgi:hypothetical protein
MPSYKNHVNANVIEMVVLFLTLMFIAVECLGIVDA